jgi:sugar/nucleoside kinase (ribokinase family)
VSILRKTLPYTDIFIPSLEEAMFMLRRSDFDHWQGDVLHRQISKRYVLDLTGQLLAMGAAVAGVKLGAYGIFVHTADQERLQALTRLGVDVTQWANAVVYHPAFEVEVAGTTGAGDAAYAGFLTSMIRGGSPADAARWACAAGACNVEVVDAISGVRSWDETLQRINSGWNESQLRLQDG